MKLTLLALAIGFALDLLIGDPEWFPHPVRLIGVLIRRIEGALRRHCLTPAALRRGAVLLTALTVLTTMLATAGILALLRLLGPWALLSGESLIAWMCLSAKCLAREAQGVRTALQRGVEAGRKQVARIVGRDTACLTEDEIVRATIETVAENTTDGVISPMLYFLLGGPVLAMGFKAASTLDSMVGYLDDQYRDIGWSSARLDDTLNYLPARLCAGMMVLAAPLVGLDARNALAIVRRDHKNHKSPNCAWSEAAAAGALHIQLGGTHLYFGKPVVKPTIGDDERPAQPEDIGRTNRLMYAASILTLALLCALLLPWYL